MKIFIVDCLGCIHSQEFLESLEGVTIREADYPRLKYEDPNRSLVNQQSTYNYLKAVDTILDNTDYDNLYFIGTNGEVLTASYIITKESSSYSSPAGYINTLDKFNFAKDFLMNEGEQLTIYTDQYFAEVYNKMCQKYNSQIIIKVVNREVEENEIPNIEKICQKHDL